MGSGSKKKVQDPNIIENPEMTSGSGNDFRTRYGNGFRLRELLPGPEIASLHRLSERKESRSLLKVT